MTDMKCPICGTPLEYDMGYDGTYSCAKCGRAIMFGSEELWQELIRTRKALDVAKEALKYARQRGLDNAATLFAVGSKADKALSEITTIEQKD